MLNIIMAIDNSPIPVVSYVYPAGSTSWSAGTYILVASHFAAMAPRTVIGSCQPISYSPLGSTPINDSKIINAMVSVMDTHARSHNRNVTLATLFITQNLNVDDEEALSNRMIEFRAESFASLLSQLDGLSANTSAGMKVLQTSNATAIEYSFRLRESILNAVADPTVSSILFLVGIFALIYGFSAPGAGGEIIGGIAVLLALFGMGFDVNVVSVVMVLIGAILLVYELVTPGFGIFGIAGSILLVIGALFLVPFTPEKWAISGDWYAAFTTIVLAAGACIVAISLFIIFKIMQVRRRRPVIGTMTGDLITAKDDAAPNASGFVWYNGEIWVARCESGMTAGKKYKIIGKDGPTLLVREAPQ